MNFASLPMILYVLPLVVLAAAIVPPQRKRDVLALGGVAAVWMTGGFPAMILLLISVFGTWLMLRLSPQKSAESRRAWLYAGIALQFFLLVLGRLMLTDQQLIPLLICMMQNMECLTEYTGGSFSIPALHAFFCYQLDVTRLPAGPLLRYADAEALHANRRVSAERIGRGASRCIRGLFQLVCLALPMYSVQAVLRVGTVRTAADALLSALSWYFGLYYGLKGTADIGRGIANMLGFPLPHSFDAPILADSLQDFRRRFLRPLYDWTERVLLRGERYDAAGYFSRMALLLGGLGFLFGSSRGGGVIWGVTAAALLTAEHIRPLTRSLPIQARRLVTAAVLVLGAGMLCGDTLFACFSFYAALLGINGIAPGDTAGYLIQTNWAVLLLCIIGLFPIGKMLRHPPRGRLLRILMLCCKAAAELFMLLAAYSGLLSRYLRS